MFALTFAGSGYGYRRFSILPLLSLLLVFFLRPFVTDVFLTKRRLWRRYRKVDRALRSWFGLPSQLFAALFLL